MTLKLDRQLERILQKYNAQARREFIRAIRGVTNNVTLARVIDALERFDVQAAINALDLDNSVASALSRTFSNAYIDTGVAVAAGTIWRGRQGSRLIVRFDMANPRAERWIRDLSSKMITNITKVTEQAVRQTIVNGFAQGQGPRQLALDIVGRIGPSGTRTGGIVGLNEPQTSHVSSMRSRLRGGSKRELKRVLGMTRRDKRFDRTILNHIKNGTRPTSKQIEKWSGRYSDRLLNLRGETIARTETATAVETAKLETFNQWQDKTGVSDRFVKRIWIHAGGGAKNRDWHLNLHNTSKQGLKEPFVTSKGSRMLHPLDTSLGAGAVDIANCRCTSTIRIDHAGLLRHSEGR